nr:B3 domain-containing protein Os03g0212300-like [Aegilops tauschii subsp. strangulata]
MAGLEGFEFFEIIIEKSCSRQRLPDKFAKMLAGRELQKVKLWQADSGRRRLWDMLVVFYAKGHMYLGPGWEHFAHSHDLQLGHFLVFRYHGDPMFTMKMFDNTMCRMYYQHDDDAKEQSRDDEEQSGEEEEQSGEVQPIEADNDLAMVVADNDLAMVVADDDLAMVADNDLAIVVLDDDLVMVVRDNDLAMVVAPAIP